MPNVFLLYDFDFCLLPVIKVFHNGKEQRSALDWSEIASTREHRGLEVNNIRWMLQKLGGCPRLPRSRHSSARPNLTVSDPDLDYGVTLYTSERYITSRTDHQQSQRSAYCSIQSEALNAYTCPPTLCLSLRKLVNQAQNPTSPPVFISCPDVFLTILIQRTSTSRFP